MGVISNIATAFPTGPTDFGGGGGGQQSSV